MYLKKGTYFFYEFNNKNQLIDQLEQILCQGYYCRFSASSLSHWQIMEMT